MANVRSSLVKYDKYGYMFVTPFILAFLIFQLYPIIYTFQLSFTDLAGWETDLNYVGFKNFASILQNELFLKAFRNTWIIWAINFVPQLGLALILAKWFSDIRFNLKGAGLFKVAFYMPNIITAASVSILFATMFGYPNGPINQLLIFFGVLEEPFEFFRSVGATRLIVGFIQFWMWYGFTFIILTAGILGINPSLYEAARVDGATSGKMFRHITLPLIRPISLYILVTSLIGGMQMFDIPFLLTRDGNPDYSIETITMFIYRQAFQGGRNYYFASTASVLLLLFILIICFSLFKAMNRKNDEASNRKRRLKSMGGNK